MRKRTNHRKLAIKRAISMPIAAAPVATVFRTSTTDRSMPCALARRIAKSSASKVAMARSAAVSSILTARSISRDKAPAPAIRSATARAFRYFANVA